VWAGGGGGGKNPRRAAGEGGGRRGGGGGGPLFYGSELTCASDYGVLLHMPRDAFYRVLSEHSTRLNPYEARWAAFKGATHEQWAHRESLGAGYLWDATMPPAVRMAGVPRSSGGEHAAPPHSHSRVQQHPPPPAPPPGAPFGGPPSLFGPRPRSSESPFPSGHYAGSPFAPEARPCLPGEMEGRDTAPPGSVGGGCSRAHSSVHSVHSVDVDASLQQQEARGPRPPRSPPPRPGPIKIKTPPRPTTARSAAGTSGTSMCLEAMGGGGGGGHRPLGWSGSRRPSLSPASGAARVPSSRPETAREPRGRAQGGGRRQGQPSARPPRCTGPITPGLPAGYRPITAASVRQLVSPARKVRNDRYDARTSRREARNIPKEPGTAGFRLYSNRK